MSKILSGQEYDIWLNKFMAPLFDKDFVLKPAIVKDRSDGKLVHLEGLNYSRAACLYGIAKKSELALGHLRKIANAHVQFSIGNLSAQDDYMGSHWLGTFALHAMKHAE